MLLAAAALEAYFIFLVKQFQVQLYLLLELVLLEVPYMLEEKILK
jgi:hypothetical protein